MRSVPTALLALNAWLPGQTVSIEQLAHKVPASAAKEYRASTKALGSGRVDESIEHCRKALEMDPDNALAHNDLGVLYLNDTQTEKALAEFQQAAKLQPRLAMSWVNESFALLALGRAGEAESAARKALEISPSDVRANLMLGWSLTTRFIYSKDALATLQLAARQYPEARLAAADVLIHNGSLAEAREELSIYLSSGNSDQKSLAETWLRLITLE